LLPAEDMVAFDKDKSITEFAGDAQQRIKNWRKGGFFEKFEPHEVKLVQKLSAIADQLFDDVAASLAGSRSSTNDAITLWPDRDMPGAKGETYHEKQRRLAKLTGDDHAANTLPYKRLKTAMDAWCALWLWPLDKCHLLPSRTEFLNGMAMILEGGFTADGSLAAASLSEFADPAPDMFDVLEPNAPAKDLFKAAAKRQATMFRETNVEALVEAWNWLGVAVQVAAEARFAHLDLMFADVLKTRLGFDIIVGNPPWAKPSWNQGDVIGDIDPGFVTRKLSAVEARSARSASLAKEADRNSFLLAYSLAKGAMTATGSAVMNPFAGGAQNNLYRCFIDLSFRQIAPAGCVALIHQDGHLTDPASGEFREHWYARARKHFEFSNKITRKNFSEVEDQKRFSLNVYSGSINIVKFDHFSNAFLASQVDDSYDHDGTGLLPVIKDINGKWDTRGHRNRIVRIDKKALETVHSLSETVLTPIMRARFLQPFSSDILEIFQKLSSAPKLNEAIKFRFNTIEIPGWQVSGYFHESGAQKLGIIEKTTNFRSIENTIIQGPIFYNGNPINKSPMAKCVHNSNYEVIDLGIIPENYIPRSNFGAMTGLEKYDEHLPACNWDKSKPHHKNYRVAARRRIPINSERSLTSAIIPPMLTHIDSVQSIAFAEEINVVNFACLTSSLVYDFLIKASGISDLYESDISRLPWVQLCDTAIYRMLQLTCLTSFYSNLWNNVAPKLAPAPWSSSDSRLDNGFLSRNHSSWNGSFGLKSPYARRLASIEIDVIVAQKFGMSLDQLVDIYRIYFPIVDQNEAATWYDRKGQIVWTASKGLPGVGWLNEKGKSPGRKDWDALLASAPPELRCKALVDFLPGGPREVERTFEGPFDTCDRVRDYRRAWTYFQAQRDSGVVV
jgi:hypothetical protein